MTPAPEHDKLAAVEALVGLSAADLPYSDLYLNRAETLLAALFTYEQHLTLRRERDTLPGLAKELRHVAECRDWQQVHTLAHRAVGGQRRINDNQRLLSLGDAVYGPRLCRVDATALALSGMVAQNTSQLRRVREECVARLRFMLEHDAERADLYRARLVHLDSLDIVAEDTAAPAPSEANLQQRILAAADNNDFEQVDRLSAALIAAAPRNGSGRLCAVLQSEDRMRMLVGTFSDATVRRARELGLSAVTLSPDGALDACLNGPPESRMTAAERLAVSAVSSDLRATLERLMCHPFLTSLGSRYVPWFGAETLLVETFPETEPETRTGLLDALELHSRRGVSRLTIEDAVRRRTTRVCTDLGLDPVLYAVVPIPFDAYLRLAPRFDWGRQQRWTHFDGYQLTPELHLRALVGGDVSYGGPEDLCSVGRDYETDRLVARFAVVHRQRLTPGDSPAHRT